MTTPLTLEKDGSLALLTLDDGRANALDRTLLEAFEKALEEARDASCLLLRGREKIFSGGLDLPSLAGLDKDAMDAFLALFDRVHDALLAFPAPIVTVAKGSAVAGGAILFAAGDERLTTPQGKIGVNEAALGLNIPSSALEILRLALGERHVAEATLSARLYEGEERLRVGFATEVHELERIDAVALERAREYAANDRHAMALLRRSLRSASLDRVAREAAPTRAAFLERWFAPETQTRLQGLVARLKSRA